MSSLLGGFSKIDGKYLVLPSGELHIKDVGPEDGYKTYQCRTKHRLTGETRLSATKGRLVITGKLLTIYNFIHEYWFWFPKKIKKNQEVFIFATLRQWSNRITWLDFYLNSIFNLCNLISVKNEITSWKSMRINEMHENRSIWS